MTSYKNQTLPGIQVLRGIAAVAVALHHVADFIKNNSSSGLAWTRVIMTDVGAGGVDLFFVISGFIMLYTTSDAGVNARDFLYRRVVRIYPLYWVYSLVVLALYFLLPWTGKVDGSALDVAKSFLLYPTLNHDGLLRPLILAQGWTLTYEMAFYLIFALFLSWPAGRRVVAVSAILVVAHAAGCLLPGHSAELIFLRQETLVEFSLGMGVGYLCLETPFRFGRKGFFITLGLALLSLVPALFWLQRDSGVHRIFEFGIPSVLSLGAVTLYRDAKNLRFPRWSVLLGDASYSLYLTHVLILILAVSSRRMLQLVGIHPGASYTVMIGMMLATGLVGYFAIEKPLLLLFRRKRRSVPEVGLRPQTEQLVALTRAIESSSSQQPSAFGASQAIRAAHRPPILKTEPIRTE